MVSSLTHISFYLLKLRLPRPFSKTTLFWNFEHQKSIILKVQICSVVDLVINGATELRRFRIIQDLKREGNSVPPVNGGLTRAPMVYFLALSGDEDRALQTLCYPPSYSADSRLGSSI